MITVYITRAQLRRIRSLVDSWDGRTKEIPGLISYLVAQDIRTTEHASPDYPVGYEFFHGGMDHADIKPNHITLYDRCLETSSGTLDGTIQFVCT